MNVSEGRVLSWGNIFDKILQRLWIVECCFSHIFWVEVCKVYMRRSFQRKKNVKIHNKHVKKILMIFN